MGQELQTVTMAGDRHKCPHLLITAGVHGDEFEPMVAVRRLATMIDQSQLSGRVTLVPIVNHSAYELGQRCGSDGLDLARTCPGKKDGTATERIAYEISELIQTADYFVDLHTGGVAYHVWPLAGYMLHRDQRVLGLQQKMATAFNLPFVWGTTPNLEGRTLSVACEHSIPAIYAEYGGSIPFCNSAVDAYCEGCLNIMSTLDMLPRAQPVSRVETIVEDDSDNSGHLQVCHPSPNDGLYQPIAKVGERVAAGQSIGIVYTDDHNRPIHVCADKSGTLVMTRNFARVHRGDGLGVVVKMSDSHDCTK